MHITFKRDCIVISIDYDINIIEKFILKHLKKDLILTDRHIIIPKTNQKDHNRTYLLKWLFMLYQRKNRVKREDIRDKLLKKSLDTIKIVKQKKTIYKIIYRFVDKNLIHIKIRPYSKEIEKILQLSLETKMEIFKYHLRVYFDEENDKKRLKRFIENKKLIRLPYKHIYDKEKLKNFLLSPIQKDPLQEAYSILDLSPQESMQIVKKRYKELVKIYHPDMIEHRNLALKDEYRDKFQCIVEAYKFIKDSYSYHGLKQNF